MSLDLNDTANQITRMVSKTEDRSDSLEFQLQHMVKLLKEFDCQKFMDKKSKLSDSWPWPLLDIPENPGKSIPVISNSDLPIIIFFF